MPKLTLVVGTAPSGPALQTFRCGLQVSNKLTASVCETLHVTNGTTRLAVGQSMSIDLPHGEVYKLNLYSPSTQTSPYGTITDVIPDGYDRVEVVGYNIRTAYDIPNYSDPGMAGWVVEKSLWLTLAMVAGLVFVRLVRRAIPRWRGEE